MRHFIRGQILKSPQRVRCYAGPLFREEISFFFESINQKSSHLFEQERQRIHILIP